METLLVLLIAATSLVLNFPVSLAQPSKQRIFTLHCQNRSFNIKSGTVNMTSEHPDLYSLLVPRPVPSFSSDRLVFTLEAIASSSLLCMTRRGRLFSEDSRKYKDKRGHLLLPPKNCLWSEYKFSSRCVYGDARGIYSVPHSSPQGKKRFLSCPDEGRIPRGTLQVPSFYKETDELCMPRESRPETFMVSYLPSTVKRVHWILDQTNFSKQVRVSTRVRRCIRRSSFFKGRKSGKKTLKSVITKCKQKVRENMEARRRLEEENIIRVDLRKRKLEVESYIFHLKKQEEEEG